MLLPKTLIMRELNISSNTFDLLLEAGLTMRVNNKYNLQDAKGLLSMSDPEATTEHKEYKSDKQLEDDIESLTNDANVSTQRQEILLKILKAKIQLAQLKVKQESILWIETKDLEKANIEVYTSLATLTFNIKNRCKLELVNLDQNIISKKLDQIIFEEIEKFRKLMHDERESTLTFYDVIDTLEGISV